MQIEHRYKNVKGLLERILYSAEFGIKTFYVYGYAFYCLVI